MAIIVTEKIHDNPKLRKFFESLDNQHDRDIAGLAISWVKETYPHFAEELNGTLIAVIERGKNV